MTLPAFKWWLSDAVSTAIQRVSQSILDRIRDKVTTVFRAARIGWTTQTGLEIFWAELNIKPNVESDLRRTFLQQYNTFLETAGTPKDKTMLISFFNLEYVYSIDMRDHERLSHLYPFHVVRFWIPPVEPSVEADIRHILGLILPARCTQHYQLFNLDRIKRIRSHPFWPEVWPLTITISFGRLK